MPLKASVEKIQKHVGELARMNPERSFEKLYRVICDETWLTEAWGRIRTNKGSKTAGADGKTKSDVDAATIKRLAETLQGRGRGCTKEDSRVLESKPATRTE